MWLKKREQVIDLKVCSHCGEKHKESVFTNGFERFCCFECAVEWMVEHRVPPFPPAPNFPIYVECLHIRKRVETEADREYERSVLVYNRLCSLYKKLNLKQDRREND